MAKTRREFSTEFKLETVALLESSGGPLMQVATEVDISPSMLRNWRFWRFQVGARDRVRPHRCRRRSRRWRTMRPRSRG